MKAGAVIRKIDELGRIVIPADMRRQLEIVARDSLEIYLSGNKVCVKKIGEEPPVAMRRKRKSVRAIRKTLT
ncbi:MAG: AbrB/MazE/SpoVT family DNA-binding domain-containing protein [Oscillospiraceae bacterium]|nr:AbrB/MazE/SpoVT family DNA-binding domain-containing protein [Oscillospiraceae bacterium]